MVVIDLDDPENTCPLPASASGEPSSEARSSTSDCAPPTGSKPSSSSSRRRKSSSSRRSSSGSSGSSGSTSTKSKKKRSGSSSGRKKMKRRGSGNSVSSVLSTMSLTPIQESEWESISHGNSDSESFSSRSKSVTNLADVELGLGVDLDPTDNTTSSSDEDDNDSGSCSSSSSDATQASPELADSEHSRRFAGADKKPKSCNYTRRCLLATTAITVLLLLGAVAGAFVATQNGGSSSGTSNISDNANEQQQQGQAQDKPPTKKFVPAVPVAPTVFEPLFINAGGNPGGNKTAVYKDDFDNVWTSDVAVAYTTSGSVRKQNCWGRNSTKQKIYCTERYFIEGGKYEIPVPYPAAEYTVVFYFVESRYEKVGERVFSILVESRIVKSKFDIFKEAGSDELMVNYTATVRDGSLTIDFIKDKNNPKVNAIKVFLAEPEPEEPKEPQQPKENESNPDDNKEDDSNEKPDNVFEKEDEKTNSGPKETNDQTNNEQEPQKPDDPNNESEAEEEPEQEPIVLKELSVPLRMNSGRGFYEGFISDVQFIDYVIGDSSIAASCPLNVTSTEDDYLYCTERYFRDGVGGYNLVLPDGDYTVTLYFAEFIHLTEGRRVFDVLAESKVIFPNFDIIKEAGDANAATRLTFDVKVTDGALTLEFTPIKGNPKISAVEVVAAVQK